MEHFLKFLFSFWGVLGKRTLNPEVSKCHEDLITLDTYVQQGETMDNKAIRDGKYLALPHSSAWRRSPPLKSKILIFIRDVISHF